MKIRKLLLVLSVLCALFFVACKERTQELIFNYDVYKITPTVSEVLIKGNYTSSTDVDRISVVYGEDPKLLDAIIKNTVIDNNQFSVTLTGLDANTQYYYCLECSSDNQSIRTSIASFTTLELNVPSVITSSVYDITSISAKSGGNVIDDGGAEVIARGICWSTEPNPTVDDLHTVDGEGVGAFESVMMDLEPNTIYYVRSYAENSKGVSYGDSKDFKTVDDSDLPIVKTVNVTDITQTTAICSGEVLSGGASDVIVRGICWNTTGSPFINDNHAVSGNGNGVYSAKMQNLLPNTKYYVRTYALNSYGVAYGEEIEFTTIKDVALPSVITYDVTDITNTSAVCGGNVIFNGGDDVTAKGVCWSTSNNPTLDDSFTFDGEGEGEFTSNITGLNVNETYYVRAYATNSVGTEYGDEKVFTVIVGVELPEIETYDISEITNTSAICGGEIINDGGGMIIAKGICWDINPEPTIDDNFTLDGSGNESFVSHMTGLYANTTYYVRAYATNGAGTNYGGTKTFTTENIFETFDIEVNGVSFKMVAVEGGTFMMGAQYTDINAPGYDPFAIDHEGPIHQVTLSNYYIGETEVTQELWKAVMGDNPSNFVGEQRPVEQVSWDDCQEFVEKLSQLTGHTFRLPTEAEWQFAAKGGIYTHGYRYSGSPYFLEVAWIDSNSGGETHVVKTKDPNELGIYDMSGNVFEWLQDWYGLYSEEEQYNPTGPETGSYRMLTGGGWNLTYAHARVTYRDYHYPHYAISHLGLRIVMEL